MNYSKLNPCPFCGFQPDLEDDDVCYPITRDKSLWGVHCPSGSGGCGASVLGDSKIEAIQTWNDRVDPHADLQKQELDDCDRIIKIVVWIALISTLVILGPMFLGF